MQNFTVKYLDEATMFIRSLDKKAAKKLLYNISKTQSVNDPSIFKKLKGSNIWEFRAKVSGIQYRLFSFWDIKENALVICTHGIVKKTQKTPIKEIERAEQLRIKYLR